MSPKRRAGRAKVRPVPLIIDPRRDIETAMRKLESWLPERVLDTYIPALAEKYIFMIKPERHIATSKIS